MSEDLKKNLELSLNNAKRLSNKILIEGTSDFGKPSKGLGKRSVYIEWSHINQSI